MRLFREFRDDDTAQVMSLHERALVAVGAYAGGGVWDNDLKNIREIYIQPGGCFYVVEEDGRLLAMGALKRLENSTAEIKRMRVDPAFQRQGLGQLVLDALLAEAKNRAYEGLSWIRPIFRLRHRNSTKKTASPDFRRSSGVSGQYFFTNETK